MSLMGREMRVQAQIKCSCRLHVCRKALKRQLCLFFTGGLKKSNCPLVYPNIAVVDNCDVVVNAVEVDNALMKMRPVVHSAS